MTAILIATSLASCGGISGGETKEIVGNDTQSAADNSSAKETTAATEETEKTEIGISEQLCFEYDGLTVTAKSIDDDSFWGTGIKLLVENNSTKDYSVGTHAVIVNDYMISDLFSCSTAAGKKSNETLYLSSDSLKAAGIGNIGKIEIYFYVYDSDTYSTVYESDCVTVKTTAFDKMDASANDDGFELYSKGGIRIVGKCVDENSFWGSAVLLYIENNTDKNVTVSCDDMSINDYMVDGLFSCSVYAGKKAIDDITVFSSDLEKNGITSIDTVELKFRIYNSDTYDTIDETESITFNAK